MSLQCFPAHFFAIFGGPHAHKFRRRNRETAAVCMLSLIYFPVLISAGSLPATAQIGNYHHSRRRRTEPRQSH
jgi:hypothetical protein